MPDAIQRNPGADISSENTEKLFHIRLGLILLLALIVVGFFFLLYAFDRNPSEGLRLLTANVLSLAVLVVIVIQAYIYSRQRRHMEEQSKAMRAQLDITRQQQRSVEQQFILLGIQADAMVNQWNIMSDSLIETRNLVEQTKQAVIAAEKGSETAQQNMIYSQRAYVVIEIATVGLHSGNAVFDLRLQNAGKTPANEIEILWAIEFCEEAPTPSADDAFQSLYVGPLEPEGRRRRHFDTPANALVVFDALDRGQTVLIPYCWGIIKYQDIFKKPRRTKFCLSKGTDWGNAANRSPTWNDVE